MSVIWGLIFGMGGWGGGACYRNFMVFMKNLGPQSKVRLIEKSGKPRSRFDSTKLIYRSPQGPPINLTHNN